MKYLMWIILAAVVVLWLLHDKKSRKKAGPPVSPASPRTDAGTEAILQCATCGVHIPKSEAVTTTTGLVFCSEEHRLRHTSS